MATAKFRVQGINGPMDLENVDQEMLSVWGVRETAVKQDDSGEVSFTYGEAAASFEDCKQAVIDRGYGVIAAEQPFGQ